MPVSSEIVGRSGGPVSHVEAGVPERATPAGLAHLTPEERLRSVHATHDLRLHRPIRAGMAVTTRPTVVRMEGRRPSAARTFDRPERAVRDGLVAMRG